MSLNPTPNALAAPLDAAAAGPTWRARWLRLQAMLWLSLGLRQPALRCFDALLARWPQDTHALASRAQLHADAQRRGDAIADLRRRVALSPPPAAADWFNLGFLLHADGQWDDAEAAFRQALALDERLDRAWYGLALVLIRQGRPDEAEAALRRNTELQPMSPYGWYQLASLHAARQRPNEALKIIRHLRGFEPRVAAQLERETGLKA